MARAAAATEGSMVALMGGDEGARAALDGLDGVWVANINGTGRSSSADARGPGRPARAPQGARVASRDAASGRGAFHSPLMGPAQDELDKALASVEWARPTPC